MIGSMAAVCTRATIPPAPGALTSCHWAPTVCIQTPRYATSIAGHNHRNQRLRSGAQGEVSTVAGSVLGTGPSDAVSMSPSTSQRRRRGRRPPQCLGCHQITASSSEGAPVRGKSIIIGIVAVVTAAVGAVTGPAPAEAATATFPQAKSCADFPAFWRNWDPMPKKLFADETRWVPAGSGLRPEPQVALRVLLRRAGRRCGLAEVPLDADRQHPRRHPDQDDLLPHQGRAPRWSCRWAGGRSREPVRRDHRGPAAGHPHPADEDRQGRRTPPRCRTRRPTRRRRRRTRRSTGAGCSSATSRTTGSTATTPRPRAP